MSKKMKIAVDTTENVSKEDWIKFARRQSNRPCRCATLGG